MDQSAVNSAEERAPLNREEQPSEAVIQAYPPLQPAFNPQYLPPAANQVGQYPPMPQYPPQGAPIAYQPADMRPMLQPQMQAVYMAPQMVNSPVTIWTRVSQTTICPYCQQTVTTILSYNHCGSSLPWVSCLGLFCSGFCLCCWVPFICESCKDVSHICPLCRRMLGRKGMI